MPSSPRKRGAGSREWGSLLFSLSLPPAAARPSGAALFKNIIHKVFLLFSFLSHTSALLELHDSDHVWDCVPWKSQVQGHQCSSCQDLDRVPRPKQGHRRHHPLPLFSFGGHNLKARCSLRKTRTALGL